MDATEAAAVLGCPADADAETVRRAYRRKALELHPDAGGDHAAMVRLNTAMEVMEKNGATGTGFETDDLGVIVHNLHVLGNLIQFIGLLLTLKQKALDEGMTDEEATRYAQDKIREFLTSGTRGGDGKPV